jgi:hypothetical protein
MGNHLYILEKRGAMLVQTDGERVCAYFLRLAVRNVFSQDSHSLVDRAVRVASAAWKGAKVRPGLVIQVGLDGFPTPGSCIFRWDFTGRAYCFESELPQPVGYLGEREIGGFLLCARKEERGWERVEPFGAADSMHGRTQAGLREWSSPLNPQGSSRGTRNGKLPKILSLIKTIESKGWKASEADIRYLDLLREKASQLAT